MMLKLIRHSVDRMWADYDKSKDGYLTLDDSRDFIRDCFGTSHNLTDEDIGGIFAKIDTDSDGKINKGEMSAFLLRLSKSS